MANFKINSLLGLNKIKTNKIKAIYIINEKEVPNILKYGKVKI